MQRFPSRISLIWLSLLAATLVSWDAVEGVEWLKQPRLAGAFVIAIAFIKTRYIMLDFMELRHAPLSLRMFAESWWLLVGLVIIAGF